MDMLMAGLLLLGGPEDVVVTGQVRFDLRAWTLRAEGVTYDLHGAPEDLAHGEWVQVVGRIERGRVCVHMNGVVLRVRSIQRVL